MKIQGCTAVVTGGASGIGKAICQALAANGARVCLIDVNAVQGEICADELKLAHGQDNILFKQADVSSQKQLEGAFDKAKSTFGRLDIVINNAGIVDENNWRACVNVNLVGVISGTRLAVDCMSKINGGSGGLIINMASVAGLTPGKYHYLPTYDATKSAVLAHTIAWSNPFWSAYYFVESFPSMMDIFGCMANTPGIAGNLSLRKYHSSMDRMLTCIEINTNPRCQQEGIRFNAICPAGVNTPILENLKPELFIDIPEGLIQYFESELPKMEPSCVAKEVMDLIEDDTKNGAIIHLTSEGVQQVRMEYSTVMINSAAN